MYNLEYKKTFSIQLYLFLNAIHQIYVAVRFKIADTWQPVILQKTKRYFLFICCIFQNVFDLG